MSSAVDLSQFTLDEFITFFFDHDVEIDGDWYQDPGFGFASDSGDDGVSSPAVVVSHMTGLFRSFEGVASRFSPQQINAGIWAMFSYGGFRLQKHLWLPSVPLTQRMECIRSMYFVYSDHVAKSTVTEMENCFLMWWDFVASGFWEHMYGRVEEGDISALSSEERSLLDTVLATLAQILVLPDERTQSYALHGLGHLHHPGVSPLIQTFLNQHRDTLTAEQIRWIEECRDGTVM